jgi:uncharacterized protein (TIGR02246 family)
MTTSRSRLDAILAALLLLALAAPGNCRSRTIAPTTGASDAQIRALYDRWTKAFEARDLDAVMSCYAPGDELVAYDVTPPLEYRGTAAYRKDFQDYFNGYAGRLHVEYRHVGIMSDGDLGVFQALERNSGRLKNGERVDIWLRVTSVARRIGGRWLIVHDHVSVPADFATGKAMQNLTP